MIIVPQGDEMADKIEDKTPAWVPSVAGTARKVYIAGLATAILVIMISGLKLMIIIMRSRREAQEAERVYISDNVASPFAWGGIIVMPQADWYSSERHLILAHEKAHVRSHHWVDLLAAHILLAVNWYNPAAWLLLRELHHLHEYEADASVIKSGTDIYIYQKFLLEKAVGHRLASLADSMHQSNLKKRITMMTKKQNRKSGLGSIAFLAPAALLAAAAVSSPAFASILDFSLAEKPVKEARATLSGNKVNENPIMEQTQRLHVADAPAWGEISAATLTKTVPGPLEPPQAAPGAPKSSVIPSSVRISSPSGGKDAIVSYDENGMKIEGDAIKINLGDEVPESVMVLGNTPHSGREIARDIEGMSIAGMIMVDNDYRIDNIDLNKLKKYSRKDLAYHIVKLASGNNILLLTPYKITRTIALDGGGKMQVFAAGAWNNMRSAVPTKKEEAEPEPLIIIDGVTYNGKLSDLVLPAQDVQSVTKLPPETGAALYGEKGANGVLIINLKSAEKDN